jgi:hypothetical protein
MEKDLNRFEPSPPYSPRKPGRLSPLTIARIKKLSGLSKNKTVDEILKSVENPMSESPSPVKPFSKAPSESERSPRVKTHQLKSEKTVDDICERLRDMVKK